MAESLLQLGGAQPNKPFKNIPLTTSLFFSGLWTQRSPFGSPDSRYYNKFLGGRTDILIDGLNTELTNYGTLIRRPGTVAYSTATLSSPALSFYPFHPIGQSISVVADTATTVSILTPSTNTSIFTKSGGAGQTYFQGVGTTLYMGNGVDQKAYPSGGTTRNWGISIGSISGATGPNGVGTGADVSNGSGNAWATPGNITANDGSFATVTLVVGGSSGSQGPNFPSAATGNTNTVGGGAFPWTNPANIEASDGIYATCATSANLDKTDDLIGTGFGFSIPSTATINGIQLEFNWFTAFATSMSQSVVQLLKAGVAVGSNKASGGTSPNSATTVSFGGSSDLWGTTWTPSDINNGSFGAVAVFSTNRSSGDTTFIDFFRITVTYSIASGTQTSDYLQGTNTSLAIGSSNIVQGILVEVKGLQTIANSNTQFQVQLLKSGNLIGTAKTGVNLGLSNAFVSFGGSSDLWGSTWAAPDINSSGFGVSMQAISNNGSSVSWSVDFVRVTVYSVGGPAVTLVAGSLTATTGYIYAFAYGNGSSGDVSNPTPPSALIKPVAQGVQISLIASTDSQVNQIRVFRTKDGGSTFFELPTSPYPNTTANVTDNASDASLQILNFFPFAAGWIANSPPPAGLTKMTYHLNRMWGTVGNLVYFSALLGDDITLGIGVECWPPANVFVFPTTVNRLLPIASGLLVFTQDDIYIITGNSRTGVTGSILSSSLFQQGVGLLSWNALDVEGNQVFLYTSDRQFISFSASGPVEIGYPIGVDIQTNISPTTAYVASLISGTQDKAVFLSDGFGIWYRCNWNQPPEGGPAWSPKASITGGLSAIASIETSPGVHQLLIGQSNGKVLARSYTAFSDNSLAYPAYATIGSLVLAKPGQLAILNSIVLELQQVGGIPTISVMLDEISSNFEVLFNSVTDPPRLPPSATVMARRWYVAQGNDPCPCRHIQLRIDFPSTDTVKNEILTVTTIGALLSEE